ncbi:MAG: T9SS type A sorting domain-containing protein [Bacteroidales bacterium]|nr:T9SS type A sorting domain-containing protein [Bacteroidales bacterium]
MKNLLLFLISFLLVGILQAEGWRSGEKQVILTIENAEQANVIKKLKLSFDPIAQNQVRAYVIPKELSKIQQAGIPFKIEIKNLEAWSQSIQFADDSWHTYQDIIDLADSLVQEFPAICQKISFGQSLGGRQLAALKISDNAAIDENEAEVMFDGGIHGDEYCGAENIIRFARDICIAYGTDPDITDLIDNREIWLYLMVNPDGRVNTSRYNNNGVDLNRDWQYMWDAWGGSPGPCSQDESKSLRDCMYNNQFVVHTTYHGGTECLSLPWSYRPNQPNDWAHIFQLAGVYSSTSTYPDLEYYQGYNGMYAINGSTKDSNYGMLGSISWSMEISNQKIPPTSQISMYYQRNRPAMLSMIEYAGYGLEGTITDAITGDPVAATIFVNNYMQCFNDPEVGDYHKYVLAGTYDITVVANGYETQTIEDVVVTSQNSTVTDFQLQPEEGHFVYRFVASQIPDNNYADEGWTPSVIGAPDMINYSIGKNGWVVLDMYQPVADGSGPDIMVYEGDATPEGYTCYAAETMDGPWISLGTASGTAEFDIAISGLSEVRYFKITDDGDGSANAADAGFDLDAIGALESGSGVYIAMYDYEIDDSNGNNNGRIDPGETVDIIINLTNNGNIAADNTTAVVSTTSPWVSIDNGSSNLGTLAQGQTGQGVFTLTANASTPEGTPFGLSLIIEANNGAYNNTYALSFSIGLIVEDWETGTFDQFDWETGGNSSWTISSQDPYEGNYCVKSGTIDNEQTTYLSISFDVQADGEIGFFKKVSSESTYDFLKFYIDGSMIDQWSGEVSWSESSYPVTEGNHTFKWEYEKDYSVSSGSDCAWVDFITLPSGAVDALSAAFVADITDICETETVSFTDVSTGDITTWEWEFEGGTPATSFEQNPVVAYSSAGSFDVTLTVSDGTDSNTITLSDYIMVDAAPEIPGEPDGQTLALPLPGETNDYTTSGSAGALSYEWMLEPAEAGEITNNGTTCTIDWTDYWEGYAELSVRAVNDCGESDYSPAITIMVIIPHVNETAIDGIGIYPNPASDKIHINLLNQISGSFEISLVNNQGSEVLNQSFDENNAVLDISQLPNGVYFLKVIDGENSKVKKVVKK